LGVLGHRVLGELVGISAARIFQGMQQRRPLPYAMDWLHLAVLLLDHVLLLLLLL
jgi:hypothetical protein